MLRLLTAALLMVAMPLGGQERPLGRDFRQEACLGSLIYHEARGEPVRGQRAVLDVAYRRVVDSGMSPCQVIAQPRQFAWYGKKPMKPIEETHPLLARAIAHPRILRNEKFFYSGHPPKWAKGMKCRRIGRHHFCKEKNGKAISYGH